MKTYTEYIIITEYGETLKKLKKILFDKKEFKEIQRVTRKEVIHKKGYETYILRTIEIMVEHNKQLKLELWK